MNWREGLYPGFWLSTREELRRAVTGTTLASLIAIAATFVTKTGPVYSRPIIVGGWLISLVSIPALRYFVRKIFVQMSLTGPKTVILGAGKMAEFIIEGIRLKRPPAVEPIAIFDDNPEKIGTKVGGVPVIGGIESSASWATERGIRVVIVAISGVFRDRLEMLIEEQSRVFPRIIVIPDLFGISAANVDIREIRGELAFELKINLLSPWNRAAKRIIDLSLLLLGSILVIPLAVIIWIAIVIESGRPGIFRHERIGRGPQKFMAWKYRTMVKNAQTVFEEALEADPELKREWDLKQKLKKDPRLTKVGKVLRRFSLDELPQLWNVFRGDMSLVGPRPITEREVQRYSSGFDLYTQVLPGLTGLWQVSGRSNLSYEDRVWLDTHYVRNWSVWLDLVILVRTIWVVIAGVGAY